MDLNNISIEIALSIIIIIIALATLLIIIIFEIKRDRDNKIALFNSLLEEFATSNTGDLQRRLTDIFDNYLNQPDDTAIHRIKEELETILQERIDALSKD